MNRVSLKHHPPPSMRTAPLPLLSLKRIASATGPNILPFVGPSSLNVSNVKESVIAKRTVKSHRTYMREARRRVVE